MDANDIAAAAGQPTSIIVKFRPVRSTICCAAGPKLSDSIPITKFRPMKPIPTVKPDLIALPNLAPSKRPKNS